eukprot:TRINITY_DN30823_c0_g1_i1.p1 TRINITY_DN30823_c0_g1~~TRINITY_DN30823_c0_g1_i1.p1  ORF type:complete len:384 (+),score=77.17 TRINITY_DN30823_c0_g1_i1:185-1336(+)
MQSDIEWANFPFDASAASFGWTRPRQIKNMSEDDAIVDALWRRQRQRQVLGLIGGGRANDPSSFSELLEGAADRSAAAPIPHAIPSTAAVPEALRPQLVPWEANAGLNAKGWTPRQSLTPAPGGQESIPVNTMTGSMISPSPAASARSSSSTPSSAMSMGTAEQTPQVSRLTASGSIDVQPQYLPPCPLQEVQKLGKQEQEAIELTPPYARSDSMDVELQRALEDSVQLAQAKLDSGTEARQRLKHVLDLYQARTLPVQGDGNCQFRALSLKLYGREDEHALVRAQVVQQLRSAPHRYSDFVSEPFEDYVERLSKDTEWGDHVSLQAASDMLGCEIHVLTDQPGGECLEIAPAEEYRKAGWRPICLTFLSEVHYDAAGLDGEE